MGMLGQVVNSCGVHSVHVSVVGLVGDNGAVRARSGVSRLLVDLHISVVTGMMHHSIGVVDLVPGLWPRIVVHGRVFVQ